MGSPVKACENASEAMKQSLRRAISSMPSRSDPASQTTGIPASRAFVQAITDASGKNPSVWSTRLARSRSRSSSSGDSGGPVGRCQKIVRRDVPGSAAMKANCERWFSLTLSPPVSIPASFSDAAIAAPKASSPVTPAK